MELGVLIMKGDTVPKPKVRLLSELEDHLFLLSEHLSHAKSDLAYFKAISAELRLLVCRSGKEGLLWRLVDDYGVSDEVRLYERPDKYNTTGAAHEVFYVGRPSRPISSPVIAISYKNYLKTTKVVYHNGNSYTHESLIKACANKMGSAHEDNEIMAYIHEMEEGGKLFEGFLDPMAIPDQRQFLIDHTELTLEIGERVLSTAERNGIYKRRRCRCYSSISNSTELRDFTS